MMHRCIDKYISSISKSLMHSVSLIRHLEMLLMYLSMHLCIIKELSKWAA